MNPGKQRYYNDYKQLRKNLLFYSAITAVKIWASLLIPFPSVHIISVHV